MKLVANFGDMVRPLGGWPVAGLPPEGSRESGRPSETEPRLPATGEPGLTLDRLRLRTAPP